jgi:DNA-binding transcriptional regulator GbsR (MarR family)
LPRDFIPRADILEVVPGNLNIPKMKNISALTADQSQFIEDLAALLIAWGQPNAAARLYGYLLLRNEPASLDDISRDLEISKTNAFGAATELERQQNLRRLGERGSKRVFFVLTDDPGAPIRNQIALLGRMETLISTRKDKVATGEAATRMAALASFHERLRVAMQHVLA